MERGDLHWVELDPVRGSEQAGRRPGVVLTRDAINRASPVVVVVPLTSFRGQRLYPSDVLLEAKRSGLRADSVALCLQVRAVSRERIGSRLGRLDSGTVARIEDALLLTLDIER